MSEEKFGFTTVRSKSFTFTHKIGKFSEQLYYEGNYHSPKYYSEVTSCNWSLAVTQKGDEIQIILQREDFTISCQELDVKMWIVDSIGFFPFRPIEERARVKFSPEKNSIKILCVSRNDFFFKNVTTLSRLRFLPKDILTVKCQISKYDSVSEISESENQSEESLSVDMKTEFRQWILEFIKTVFIGFMIISAAMGDKVSQETWDNWFTRSIVSVITLMFIFSLLIGGIVLIYYFCFKPLFLQIVFLMHIIIQTVIPSVITAFLLVYAIFILIFMIKAVHDIFSKFFESKNQPEVSLSVDVKTESSQWISGWWMENVFGYLIIRTGLMAYKVSKKACNEYMQLIVLVTIFLSIFSLLIGGVVLICYFFFKPFFEQIVLIMKVIMQIATPFVISSVLLAYAIVILIFMVKSRKPPTNRTRLMTQSRSVNVKGFVDLIDRQLNRSITYVTDD